MISLLISFDFFIAFGMEDPKDPSSPSYSTLKDFKLIMFKPWSYNKNMNKV